MSKALSHLLSIDSRPAGLAGVCLALAKTNTIAAGQLRNHEITTPTDLYSMPNCRIQPTCLGIQSP